MRPFGKIVLLSILGIVSLSSCDPNLIYEENKAVENNTWASDDIKIFEFDIEDTISPINIYINLRTTSEYPYSNIYMYLSSEYPTGEYFKDTLEFILAEPDGKWLGENTGTVVEFQTIIASGGRFSRAGTYKFSLQQAMREEELGEVIDVGMRVEKKED